MMAALLDWFTKFPALWAAGGFIIGGIATGASAIFVFNKYGDKLVQVNDKIVQAQDKQLGMMERTLGLQKEHYEGELNELRKHHEIELGDAKREWQECRTLLHAKREEWQDESLKMQLAIKEFESRPDMRTLNTTLEGVVLLIKTVSENLDKHDKSIDARMKEFVEAVRPSKT
jgi:gas vesicle protein